MTFTELHSNIINMITVHPQYIVNSEGQKVSVILSIQEFKSLLQHLEELDDIRLYDNAKKGKQEFIDIHQAFKEIEESRKTG